MHTHCARSQGSNTPYSAALYTALTLYSLLPTPYSLLPTPPLPSLPPITHYHHHQVSIQNALYSGCLNSWTHGNLDIDVLFDAHANPSSKFYIQFNMEQVGQL
jgi:hypothetical protein